MKDCFQTGLTFSRNRLVESEIRDKIERAIEELPEKCREIFVLNRQENLKYQEIAIRLEILRKNSGNPDVESIAAYAQPVGGVYEINIKRIIIVT